MSELTIKDILYRLDALVVELEDRIGRKQHCLLGMNVGLTDYIGAVQLLIQVERLLEKYSSLSPENESESWDTIIANYDPDSRKILAVHKPPLRVPPEAD